VGNAVMQKRDYDITRAAMTVDIYLGWDLLWTRQSYGIAFERQGVRMCYLRLQNRFFN
jgi:hypothetical protein